MIAFQRKKFELYASETCLLFCRHFYARSMLLCEFLPHENPSDLCSVLQKVEDLGYSLLFRSRVNDVQIWAFSVRIKVPSIQFREVDFFGPFLADHI